MATLAVLLQNRKNVFIEGNCRGIVSGEGRYGHEQTNTGKAKHESLFLAWR
jgi:hypothetical protein